MNLSIKILIVDDSTSLRKIMKRMLNDIGFMFVVEAPNGKVAMDLLLDQSIDLIISDWNMPQMNGLELLKQVRSHSDLKDIPFVLVTAEGLQHNLDEAKQYEVSKYILKPFSNEQLSEIIKSIFSNCSPDTIKEHCLLPTQSTSPSQVPNHNRLEHKEQMLEVFMRLLNRTNNMMNLMQADANFPAEKIKSLYGNLEKACRIVDEMCCEMEAHYAAPCAREKNNGTNPQQYKFLIVDDDAMARMTLFRFLNHMGFLNITQAENGYEAVEILKESPFDLIISDMHMPGLSGLDLLKFVKSEPSLKSIPFLMVTADSNPNTIIDAIKARLSHYLSKPVSIKNLENKLKLLRIEPPIPVENR